MPPTPTDAPPTTRTPSLRAAAPDDFEFLYGVYASTREDELSVVAWDEAEREAFLRQQFNAQHTYYQEQFSEARFDIVLLDARPVGRLYVDRRQDELRILDIALLPAYRGAGLGSRLLEDLIAEAHARRKPVRIHVERNNPALRLYCRLGFVEMEDLGVYHLMECPPPSEAA